jgi:predicted phosphodiesterase
MRKFNIPSDFIQSKSLQPIVYKQYDNGDKLEVELYDDGEKITLTDETVLAFFQLEDGTVFQRTCIIDNGNAVATLDNNILSQSGKLIVEFTIYKDNTETSTRSILISVEKSINRNQAIETIPQWDIVQQVLDFKPSLESLILDTEIAVQYATESGEYAIAQGDYVESKKPIIDKFTGDQTNLQAQLDALVIEGDSSPAAAQARVDGKGTTYATLKQRLDTKEAEFASSLAEKATKTEVSTKATNASVKTKADESVVTALSQNINFMKILTRSLAEPNNKVKNPKFADTTIWSPQNTSFTVSNNVGSIAQISSGATANLQQTTDIVGQSNKKIYVRGKLAVNNVKCTELGFRLFGTGTVGTIHKSTILNPIKDKVNTISDVITHDGSTTTNLIYQVYTQYANNADALAGITTAQDCSAIDLTSLFGAGNEPTKEWCDNFLYVNNNIEKFTIYAITDIHIATIDGIWTANKTERLRRMQSFVDIVNTDKPDLVMHLGDAVQSTVDWNSFMPLWNSITPQKLFIAGNHDFDDGETFNSIATKFGYTSRAAINGNKFNYSQVITLGNVKFLLLNLDTNTDYSWGGKLDQARLDWIANQLNTTTCAFAVIFSHALPHDYPSAYFIESSAIALKNIVDNAFLINPYLKKIQHIGGHKHPASTTMDTTTLGANYPGLSLKSNTDATGSYTKITIDAQNNFTWESKTL